MMKSLSKRLPFSHFWSILVVVACGGLTTLLLTLFISQLEQQALVARFTQLAEDEFFAIHTNLNWYLEPLEAVAAFYHASLTVNRQEFATFVKPFLADRPGIEAIQWIPNVPAEQRLSYETQVRQETAAGYPFSQFTFQEYNQKGTGQQSWIPTNTRTNYYPLYYQEARRTTGLPLGFDFGSDPTYAEALTAAREQGQSVAIEQPAIARPDEPASFVIQIFYPLYATNAPVSTKTAQAPLIGFVSIVLRAHAVLGGTPHVIPTDKLSIALYDQGKASIPRLLYQHGPQPVDIQITGPVIPFFLWPRRVDSPLRIVKSLTTLNKQWQLVLQPTTAYIAQNASWSRWLIWICGLLSTGSVAFYLSFVLQRNRNAESMVHHRTEQLHQTNEQLQTTLQELQFQKSLLECTSEAAQDGILVVSPERKWLFFNQRFVDMWQLPPTIVEQRSSAEGVPWIVNQVANPQRARQNIEQLYADPVAQAADEISLKSGAVYERFSAPVQRADGYIYARVWYFRDISQRKQAEEALRQSEAQNRALVNAIPDLLFRVNQEGIFLECHGSTDYLALQAPEAFIGRRIDDLFSPESAQQIKARIAHALAHGEATMLEYEMPLGNGESRAWEQRTSMLNESEVLLIIRDITARKRAEAALQASQQELQKRQQHEKALVEEELARVRNQLVTNTRLATLGQVAATIAHELRNPLGAVRNAVYYMRHYLVKGEQEILEFLHLIDREVSTADRIITDLLEMSRAKVPGLQALDVCAIAHEVWPQLTQQAPISLHCTCAQDPFWVWADATQFRQILTNLLNNAVQAMPQGGEVSIYARYEADSAIITIQDSGPGVPAPLHEQIFEPLFTTKAKGTGLGLTLCRQIMEKHGGSIRLLASAKGATFELRFPNKPDTGAR